MGVSKERDPARQGIFSVTFWEFVRLLSEGGKKVHRDILEQLYVRYYKPAFLYTLSLCSDRDLAEDIVADAFVKLYLSLSDQHASFQYLLLRVCKNLWIDHLRRQNRSVPSENDPLREVADGDTPEERLLQNERLSVLYHCMRRLPEAEREILVLYYFANLRLREIAQLLQATPGSIKTRMFRARRNLKKILEDNGYEF